MVDRSNKTLLLSAPFGEYSIKLTDIPTPSPGQVVVKVEAAALNPADVWVQVYGMFKDNYPLTLGIDGAGVVEDSAADVIGFVKGDRVAFQGWVPEEGAGILGGTLRQYLAIPAFLVAKIPSNISFEAGSTLPICLATVAISLYSAKPEAASLRLSPPWEGGEGNYAGKSFLVIGGASQVGLFALQFAKLSGFNPIIATASAHNTALVKEYGATHVIDRTLPTDKIVEEITAIAGGPIDLVYDAVSSGDTPTIATGALRHGGQVVFVIPYQADALEKLKAEKAAQTIFAEGIMSYRRNQGAIPGLLQKLPELLEKGILKPTPFEILPGGFKDVAKGLERLKNGQVSGVKLVVRPQDTEA